MSTGSRPRANIVTGICPLPLAAVNKILSSATHGVCCGWHPPFRKERCFLGGNRQKGQNLKEHENIVAMSIRQICYHDLLDRSGR